MNSSQSILAIAPALLAAQMAITHAVKDTENPFYHSSYADLQTVIEATKPHLNSNGIVFMQGPGFGMHGVTVETVFIHAASGEWMSSMVEIPLGPKADAQAVGSAITYGKRFGLQAMTGLPTEDDDANSISRKSASGTEGGHSPKTIPTSFKHTPNDGAWEAMTADQQEVLTKISWEIGRLMKAGDFQGAVLHAREQGLDNDEKHALNTLLDSKQRSAMKRAGVEIDMAAATARMKADGTA